MRGFLTTLYRTLIEFIYPPTCAFCEVPLVREEEAAWCLPCRQRLRRLEADFTAPHLAHAWFDRARSCVPFEGSVREAIHGFKYSARFDLARAFVRLLAEEARTMMPLDVVMPVPLHPRRLMTRGFNQAALVARGVAQRLKVRCDLTSLMRTREVGPQVERERAERIDAVKGIFAVRTPAKVKGVRILLIDDVLTTGATVNECARVLKKAGATRVDVLTIARPIH